LIYSLYLEGLDVAQLSLRNACNTKGHKGDLGVTPGTCVMFGKVTQVDLVLDVGPQAL
jgi:hypothetical protein